MSLAALAVQALIGGALVATALGIVVLVRGPCWADRIIAIDVLFVAGLALTIGAALHTGRKEFLDAGMVLAMIAFVATVGWARVVEYTGIRSGQKPPDLPAYALLPFAVTASAAPGALALTAGAVCTVAGSLLLVIGAWGVLRMPDALSRQHAATKACTVAIPIVALGASLIAWNGAWTIRLVAMVAFLYLTLPLASIMLTKAAVAETDDPRVDQARMVE